MFKRTVVIVCLGLLMAAGAALAQVEEKSFTLGAGEPVRVATVAGAVTVTAWDQPGQVRVKAVTKGEGVQPEMVREAGALAVREKHAEGGKARDDHGSVDFEVFVPRDARVEIKTVSGAVRCEGLSGGVCLKTVSGDVEAKLGKPGPVELSSVSGQIRCAVGEGLPQKVNLRSVSGDIDLALPSGAGATISARSVSGEMSFPAAWTGLHKRDGYGSVSLDGAVGPGGCAVNVTTVSGDFKLH
ncbi:MAG: DUF4097 family beta strand repeat protein [Acidobacteria bacterium]|nr:DUF4097 family beta strand repeat protein [Acidobacteriota bacterium]